MPKGGINMTTAHNLPKTTYEVDIRDIEYLRHQDKPLLARMYVPRGTGPFPGVVELHGGGWCKDDRTSDAAINTLLAQVGIVVAALDFRMPPDAGYPASMADINYGIRWLKLHGKDFGINSNNLGVMGTSSGAHQAMLAAMRPGHPHYSAIPHSDADSAVDARVNFVVMLWPVIDPLSRYRYLKALKEAGKSVMQGNRPYGGAEFTDLLQRHEKYWHTEDAMAEGNPTLILERGESIEMPPTLYLQGTEDRLHPREALERFVASYRQAGGRLELELYEGVGSAFITNISDSTTLRALERILLFVRTHDGPPS